MNSSIFEQRSRFAMIGALMVIISLMFLFYMGSSLVSSTKKYLEQIHEIEITCIDKTNKNKQPKGRIIRRNSYFCREKNKSYGREE